MNLLADEGIDKEVVDALRKEGHQVLYIAEMAPGIVDEEVLNQANQNACLLFTSDKDFGELVFRLKKIHSGVILLRLGGLPVVAKIKLILDAVKDHGADFVQAFSVVAPGNIRIRKMLDP